MFTLKGLAAESWMGSGKAGLYRPKFPRRSRPKSNAEFLLAVEMGRLWRSLGVDAGTLVTLWYSSSGRGHWPLGDAGSLSGMPNFYWPRAHPGSPGQLSRAPNSHWLPGERFSASFSGIF